jgi:hypothetical protein
MGNSPFVGGKANGRAVDHTTPSNAKVKERVELYIYSPSGSLQPVLGWNFTLQFRVEKNISLHTSVYIHQSTYISLQTSVYIHQSTNISLQTSVYIHQSTNISLQTSVYKYQSTNVSLHTSVYKHQSTYISLQTSVYKYSLANNKRISNVMTHHKNESKWHCQCFMNTIATMLLYTSSTVKTLKNAVSNNVYCHRISLGLSLWFGGETFLWVIPFSGTK